MSPVVRRIAPERVTLCRPHKMVKNVSILLLLAIIVALPFVFRQPPPQGDWKEGDPTLVIVSPHSEAIRYEFALAFSKWHQQKYGKPVRIDWRSIGGTTEISRYLASEYAARTQAWWQNQGKNWPDGAADDLVRSAPPKNPDSAAVWKAYRATDKADQISCGIDLFFGGGEYDHSAAHAAGFTVPMADELPRELFKQNGVEMIPATYGGEIWRTPYLIGNAVSTFGIIYNVDRIQQLHMPKVPSQWVDLADYRYFGELGLSDPTKSGSSAKAFEMIVHQRMHDTLVTAGYDDDKIAANEAAIDAYRKQKGAAYRRGDVPEELAPYQAKLEDGFIDGLRLLQEIGANARYFTDAASKVPIDVSMGDAAVGMAIDFYGRFQAQSSVGKDGRERMKYVTPVGGTSVSVDPISLLRGAPSRDIALHFIEFVLSDDGQKLWNFAIGTPGGPTKYNLRRLPIRRDFYPSTQPQIAKIAREYDQYGTDQLGDPSIDPYVVGKRFTYYRRWTGEHFSFLRDFVRVACMDSGDELKAAWKFEHSTYDYAPPDPVLGPFPVVSVPGKDGQMHEVKISWRAAPDLKKQFEPLDLTRAWLIAFRNQYNDITSGKLKGTAHGYLGLAR